MGKGRDSTPEKYRITPKYKEPVAEPALSPGKPIHHPLEESWTFWILLGDRSLSWGENLREIGTVRSVETFWSFYHHIRKASQLYYGQDMSLFKEGIEPMWEDPKNKNGGQWMISPWVDKPADVSAPDLDYLWRETLMALVGGVTFMNVSHNICGATFCRRSKPKERFTLWTSDAEREDLNIPIGRRWKEVMGINAKIRYEDHADEHKGHRSAKSSGLRRCRHEV